MTDEWTDVVVIGGGGIGCATAWELARRGARVTLLERGSLPSREATWAAAGMLSPLGEASRDDAYLRFSSAALDRYAAFAESLEAVAGEHIEYRTHGKLYVALDDEDGPIIDRLIDRGAAFDVERLDSDRVHALEPALSESVYGAVLVRRDHRVDNRRLGAALASAAAAAGVDVRPQAVAREIRTRAQDGRRVVNEVAVAGDDAVRAPRVVIAAGAWSGLLDGLPRPLPVRPVRGQMFAVRAAETGASQTAAAPLLTHVIMTRDCYVIPRDNGTVLVGATAEDVGFAPGPTPCGLRTLAAAAATALPAIGELPIVETWAGYRPGTPDGMPILGADPDVDGLYYATGHFRSGILLAPITAEVIADLITGATPAVDIASFGIQRLARQESSPRVGA